VNRTALVKHALSKSRSLIPAAAAILISAYLFYLGQIPGYTIQEHGFEVKAGLFIGVTAAALMAMAAFWVLYSRQTGRMVNGDFYQVLSRDALTYLPVLLILLLPAAHAHYLTAEDLFYRVQLFGMALFFGVLYLKAAQIRLLVREKRVQVKGAADRFAALSPKKKRTLLFLVTLVIYSAGSIIMLSEGITLSGDEPHYMVISQSLWEDGDFALANNYAEHDYRKYMPPTTRLKPHIAPRTGGEHSFHSPGISILLLPFYALGSLFGGKLQLFIIRFGMSLFGALLGLQVYLFARREWHSEKTALGLWVVFSFTSPVFFHALHIYPEIIVTFFSLLIFRWLRFSQKLSKFQLLAIGLMLSLFVWLHAVKYTLILIPFFLYCLWEMIKKHRPGWGMGYFLFFPVIFGFLHMFFSHNLYGSLSPFAVSLKGATGAAESAAFLKSMLTEFSLSARLETLAGYFFDQRDGLLFYAPLYFFVFLGMVEMLRRRRRDFFLLLFLTAPYVLFHAFLTQRASFAPHARILVAVFWTAMIFLGYFMVYNAKKIFIYLFRGSVFIGFIMVYLLLRNPWALYQSTTYSETEPAGRLFVILSSLQFYLPDYLPSYLKRGIPSWTVNIIWLAAAAVFVLCYLLVKKHDVRLNLTSHLIIVMAALFIFFAWFVLYPQTPLQDPVPAVLESGKKVIFYGLGRVARMPQPGRFRFPSDNREYVYFFTSWQELDSLQLDFGTTRGDYYVQIHLFDKEIYRDTIQAGNHSLNLSQPAFYPYEKRHLYRISIYMERKSAVSMIEHPFRFSIR
jgi:hypothetical protein